MPELDGAERLGRLGQGILAQLITAYGYADGRCISDW